MKDVEENLYIPGDCINEETRRIVIWRFTKTENCESFFNFFSTPQIPDDEQEIDEDTVSLALLYS